MYERIISGVGKGFKELFSGAASFAGHSPGAFMATGGAIAGAAASIYQGDNYSSTALMRNAISGAAVGAGMGLLGRGLFTRTAARGAGRFLGLRGGFGSSPVGKLGKFAFGGARTAGGSLASVGGLLARHPQIGMAGAIVAGGAYALSGSFTTEQDLSSGFSTDGRQVEQLSSQRDFANSASGLCFGLNARRHG